MIINITGNFADVHSPFQLEQIAPRKIDSKGRSMNGLKKFVMMALIFLVPQTVNATPPSGKLVGEIYIQELYTYTCKLEINIDYTPGGAIFSIKPDSIDFMCKLLTFLNMPYPMTYTWDTGPINLWFDYVYIDTITISDCFGRLDAYWSGDTLFIDGLLLSTNAAGPCSIMGYLEPAPFP